MAFWIFLERKKWHGVYVHVWSLGTGCCGTLDSDVEMGFVDSRCTLAQSTKVLQTHKKGYIQRRAGIFLMDANIFGTA